MFIEIRAKPIRWPVPGRWARWCDRWIGLRSPLGPIESWPQSLRTTVSLCLASNFPISLAWGPKHIQIYNDGHWPICGKKHPAAMGQDFSECWASAWPVIGEAFERALAGETSYLENREDVSRSQWLPGRNVFHLFVQPHFGLKSGGGRGLFHPVTETTAEMVGERRAPLALRDLAAQNGKAKTTEEALCTWRRERVVKVWELDVPFAIFYRLDARAK